MARNDTLIFRVALQDEPSICRYIEAAGSTTLYRFAEAIVSAFGFDFDHAFGFYSGDPYATRRSHASYELFADMGEADAGILGVKKTPVAQAFPEVGHTMTFLFDYGDDWYFSVKLTGTGKKVAKVRYPRLVASQGKAPEQYPEPDELDDDGPAYGINLATGDRIKIG